MLKEKLEHIKSFKSLFGKNPAVFILANRKELREVVQNKSFISRKEQG